MMASLLIFYAREAHVNTLAESMFKAKTSYLTNLPAFDMVRADQKTFTFGGTRVGFATLEVNEPEKVMHKAAEIIVELRLLKKDKGLDYAFLSVVDLAQARSDLIICGAAELHLAKEAFKGEISSAFDGLGRTPLWQLQRSCSGSGSREHSGHGKEEGDKDASGGGGGCTHDHDAGVHAHAHAQAHAVMATHGGRDLDGDGTIGGYSPYATKMDLGACMCVGRETEIPTERDRCTHVQARTYLSLSVSCRQLHLTQGTSSLSLSLTHLM